MTKYFYIYLIVNSKRTTCACTNEIRIMNFEYEYGRAEFSDISNCASSCNSGNDTYCGAKSYAAIYKISNSTTGILC